MTLRPRSGTKRESPHRSRGHSHNLLPDTGPVALRERQAREAEKGTVPCGTLPLGPKSVKFLIPALIVHRRQRGERFLDMLSPEASPMVPPWDFLEYKGPEGNFPVADWWNQLSPRNQVKADLFLQRIMTSLNTSNQLSKQDFRRLRHKKISLWEVRWRGENSIPHRILCDPLAKRSLTFLCGCTHKQRQYDPRNAKETAKTRSNDLRRGKAMAHGCTFWSLEKVAG